MNACLFLPEAFDLRYSNRIENCIYLGLISRTPFGTCPLCSNVSSKVHSFYERKVQDLPISGKTVKLSISARKFFCLQGSCSRKVFAERFGSCLTPWQRRLERSNGQIQAIGLSCGSKPGARVCELIGLPVSASTVLRIIRKTKLPEVVTPKVLGVDDFAFKKGHTYGTILVDLEQRKPIDLLPDREGKTLEQWLKAHPGVEVVTRDRSAVYANAITNACSDAIQVADRWHLLKNLSENVEKYLDSQRSLIKEAAQELSQNRIEELKKQESVQSPPTSGNSVANNGNPTEPVEATPSVETTPTEKRGEYYKEVKRLRQQGHPIKAITRHLGISRNTVRKYLRQENFAPRTNIKRSNLLHFEDYLRKRWTEGETCVYTLYKEIKSTGYDGSYTRLTVFMASYPKRPKVATLPPAQKGAAFSNRTLSIALCQKEEEWEDVQRPLLSKLLQKSDLLRQVRDLSLEFKTMMEQKKGRDLESWCQQAVELTAFKGFVRGIRQDFQAVQQAFSSNWSNGQTEGQVNRLKNIKRQMYGKASFQLLRLRVLARVG